MIDAQHSERHAADHDHFVEWIGSGEKSVRELVVYHHNTRTRRVFGIREIAARDDVAALDFQPGCCIPVDPDVLLFAILVTDGPAASNVRRYGKHFRQARDRVGFVHRDRWIASPYAGLVGSIAYGRKRNRATIDEKACRARRLEILRDARINSVNRSR